MEPDERWRLEALRADMAAQARTLRNLDDPRSAPERRLAERPGHPERRGDERRKETSLRRQQRGMRKRLEAEWLASLTPEERAAERFVRRRALAIAFLVVAGPAALLAACAALLSLGSEVLGVAAGVYLLLLIARRIYVARRERRLFAEHAARARPQLERVIDVANRASRIAP